MRSGSAPLSEDVTEEYYTAPGAQAWSSVKANGVPPRCSPWH